MNNRNRTPSPFSGMLSFSDLPTHLPNTVPKEKIDKVIISSLPTTLPTSSSDIPVTDLKNELTIPSEKPEQGDTELEPNVLSERPAGTTPDISSELPLEFPSRASNSNTADDEASTTGKDKIFIPGTTITLETQEDIDKWIAERKKKWPTRKNVEEKQRIQDEKKKNSQSSDLKKRPDSLEHNSNSNNSNKRARRICHFYQQHKKCKFGTKCKNVHEQNLSGKLNNTTGPSSSGTTIPTSSASVIKMVNNFPVNIPQRFKSEFYNSDPNSGTLFKMLVQKDQYEHENETILKFIEFLDSRNLIDHNITPK